MSRSRNGGSRFKRLAVVPGSGNRELAARDVPPAFDGTIASACESMGISIEKFIEMMRWAKDSDPRVARFLDAWDALGASEQRARRTADAVREQVGLAPPELLGFVADAAFRASMCMALIIAAGSHPRVVEKTVERALTDEGIADRITLHKITGALPTPKGSQTTFTIMQNAQANQTARSIAGAPPPEQTIRRLADRFNESRGLPPAPAAKDTEAVPFEVPDEEEDDGE